MAQARLSVRKIREVLRLRAEGYSEREIAQSVGCARSSVQICLWRAERAGVGWPLPAELDDAALEAHRTSPHFLQLAKKDLPKIGDRTEGHLFEPLG